MYNSHTSFMLCLPDSSLKQVKPLVPVGAYTESGVYLLLFQIITRNCRKTIITSSLFLDHVILNDHRLSIMLAKELALRQMLGVFSLQRVTRESLDKIIKQWMNVAADEWSAPTSFVALPLLAFLAIWPCWAPTVEQHGTGSCRSQSPPQP